jgi:hypothetical protein
MSEQMRKEFEEWLGGYSPKSWLPDLLQYADPATDALWSCWQASRQALVVELPKGEGDECGHVVPLADVEDALDKAGVSYK